MVRLKEVWNAEVSPEAGSADGAKMNDGYSNLVCYVYGEGSEDSIGYEAIDLGLSGVLGEKNVSDVRFCVQIYVLKEVHCALSGARVVVREAIGEGLELERGVGL